MDNQNTNTTNNIITLSHGSGGKMTHKLIDELFHRNLSNDLLLEKGDSAILQNINGKLAFTTDSYVITPLSFPGGDIGKLAICGTVNDLAVCGAKPLYLSCGFIIEEGLEIQELEQIVRSMAATCHEAQVKIVTGDTKVVPRGACDKLFINTSGIGVIGNDVNTQESLNLSQKRITKSDKVIVSGTIGDHESAIMLARENFNIHADIKSDCAPLNTMISQLTNSFGNKLHIMRDATRGGLASTLNEFVENTPYSIILNESNIPLNPQVEALCEMLGLDPLYMANEGKIVIICEDSIAKEVINTLKTTTYGVDSAIIGDVINDTKGKVYMKTSTGGSRIVDMLSGVQLPRIC